MNNNKIMSWTAAVLAFISSPHAYSQGSFSNLNFESAKIIPDQSSPYYPFAVHATNALPGWTIYGGASYPDVIYNSVSLGAPAISIHDTNDPNGFLPIAGRYSVYLQAGNGAVAIAQTGQIPAATQSLTFLAYFTGFQISFNGQPLPYVSLGSGMYGGDISSFAGQTGELRFSGGGMLDNIQFSNQPIPEPSGLALFTVGTLLLGFFRRQNSS